MDNLELARQLHEKNDSKIVLLVADGLGGLPVKPGGPTELEAAKTPHLDALARNGVLGNSIPILPGITPGSGPGHLSLFGYDPLKYIIGRGVLESVGIGFELTARDVAARGNFCTLDDRGNILDRRAGRIPTEESAPLAGKLAEITLPGVDIFVEPVREHRFVLVLRGDGLGSRLPDTDPQATGVPPLEPTASDAASEGTAKLVKEFVRQAQEVLKDQSRANGVTLRGFASLPEIPQFKDVFGLRAAAIAVYPMYKGLASLVGMDIVGQAQSLSEEIDIMKEAWSDYDFFFVHFKYTDSTGEDGAFDKKVERIEEFDAIIPGVTALDPTVLIVTGDHSTPCLLKSHSWHPVPTLLAGPYCRPDRAGTFGEDAALMGGLGHFEGKYLMLLAMAHAGRLGKFGA